MFFGSLPWKISNITMAWSLKFTVGHLGQTKCAQRIEIQKPKMKIMHVRCNFCELRQIA
jgi:hypothetical protein